MLGDPEIWVKTSEKDDADEDDKIDQLVSVDKALDLIEIPEDGPMTFACEVEVRPEFELPKLEA